MCLKYILTRKGDSFCIQNITTGYYLDLLKAEKGERLTWYTCFLECKGTLSDIKKAAEGLGIKHLIIK